MSNAPLVYTSDGSYHGIELAVPASQPLDEAGNPIPPASQRDSATGTPPDGQATKAQLSDRAKALGLTGYSRLNRDDLEAFVTAADQVDAEGEYDTEGLEPDDFTKDGSLKVATQREQDQE